MESKVIEALKVVKEYCKSIEGAGVYDNVLCCDKCKIGDFCNKNFNDNIPEEWDLSDLEKDGGE